MFCPNCGANLPEKASFCPRCGFNLAKLSPMKEPVTPENSTTPQTNEENVTSGGACSFENENTKEASNGNTIQNENTQNGSENAENGTDTDLNTNGNGGEAPHFDGNTGSFAGYNGNMGGAPGSNGNMGGAPGFNGNMGGTPGFNGNMGGPTPIYFLQQEEKESKWFGIFKKFATSKLYLTSCILFTASLIWSFLTSFASLFYVGKFSFTLSFISILLLICVWNIRSSGKSVLAKTAQSSLTIAKVVTIVEIVLCSIISLVGIVTLIMAVTLPPTDDLFFEMSPGIFILTGVVVLLLGAFGIVYSSLFCKTIGKIKASLNDEKAVPKINGFVAYVPIVVGAQVLFGSLFSLYFPGLPLVIAIMSSIYTVLIGLCVIFFGISLASYKSMIKEELKEKKDAPLETPSSTGNMNS